MFTPQSETGGPCGDYKAACMFKVHDSHARMPIFSAVIDTLGLLPRREYQENLSTEV